MRPHTRAWIALGVVGAWFLIISLVDFQEAPSPVIPEGSEDPLPHPKGFYAATIGEIGVGAMALLVAVGAIAAAAAWYLLSVPAHGQSTTIFFLAGMCVLGAVLGVLDALEPYDAQERRDSASGVLLITALWFLVVGYILVTTAMDGFAQGNLVVLGILQLFVHWGWLGIPGTRTYVLHAMVSLALLVLVAGAVLFHQWQQPRPRKEADAAAA